MTLTPVRSTLQAVAAAAVLAGSMAGPAAAHEGEAVIEVDAAHETPEGMHYIVEVTWADDGHAAVGATVTATSETPGGEQQAPVQLGEGADPEDGLYEGTVEMPEPGDWTVTFASIDPQGSSEPRVETVEEEEPEESAAPDEPAEPETGAADPDEGAGAAGDAVDDGEPAEPEVAQTGDGDLEVGEPDEDDGAPVLLLVAVFLGLGLLVALAFWLIVRRRGAGGADGGEGSGTRATGAAPDDPGDEVGADAGGADGGGDGA